MPTVRVVWVLSSALGSWLPWTRSHGGVGPRGWHWRVGMVTLPVKQRAFPCFHQGQNCCWPGWLPTPACKCAGGLAENAPELDFLPAILPGSLDLLLGVMGVLSRSFRCPFMERPCLPSLPASAPQQPLALAFPFSLARLACPPVPSRGLRLLASVAQLRSPCWPWGTRPHLTHCSCWFVRRHCAFVREAHSCCPSAVALPAWEHWLSSQQAVVWWGRAGTWRGAPCSPLPRYPSYHVGLDPCRGARSQGVWL